MTIFFSIPKELFRELLSDWLDLQACALLDSAASEYRFRALVLDTFHEVVQHCIICSPDRRNNIYSWVIQRGIKLDNLRIDGLFDLNEFKVIDKTRVRHLCLELRNTSMSDFINLCPTLESLELSCYVSCCNYLNFNPSVLQSLISLSLEGGCFGDKLINVMLPTAPLLEKISGCEVDVTTFGWCKFIESKSNLRVIRLSSVYQCSLVFEAVIDSCRNIEVIDLHDIGKVDLSVVPRLIEECEYLRTLCVEFPFMSLFEWTRVCSDTLYLEDAFGLVANKIDIGTPGFMEVLTAFQYTAINLSELFNDQDLNLGRALLISKDTLTKVHLQHTAWINGEDLRYMLQSCRRLKKVIINSLNVTDQEIEDSLSGRVIDCLCVSGIEELRSETVARVASKCELVECKVQCCPKVDVQAVQGSVGGKIRVVDTDICA